MQTHGIIAAILPVHVIGGVLALAFGYVALYAAKAPGFIARAGSSLSSRCLRCR